MEHLGRIVASFFGGVVLLFVFILILQSNSVEQTGKTINSAIDEMITPPIKVGYNNMEEELSKNSLVQSLPKDSIILLKFYNFNSEERVWEKAYVLGKGEASETPNFNEKADIVLSLDSKYLKELTNKNFCSIIQKANKNGDLGFETDLSKISLAWKFKSAYEYKDCLGI